jgi:hypothetical protein
MFLRIDGDATAWTSGDLALVSGHSYSLAINPGIANGSTDTGTVLTFGLAPVPAPGAAALLGLAGLTGARRRRRAWRAAGLSIAASRNLYTPIS